MSMVSWFRRFPEVNGSWFHRFRGVKGFMVSWCQWFHDFRCFAVSMVSWFHRSVLVLQAFLERE